MLRNTVCNYQNSGFVAFTSFDIVNAYRRVINGLWVGSLEDLMEYRVDVIPVQSATATRIMVR